MYFFHIGFKNNCNLRSRSYFIFNETSFAKTRFVSFYSVRKKLKEVKIVKKNNIVNIDLITEDNCGTKLGNIIFIKCEIAKHSIIKI